VNTLALVLLKDFILDFHFRSFILVKKPFRADLEECKRFTPPTPPDFLALYEKVFKVFIITAAFAVDSNTKTCRVQAINAYLTWFMENVILKLL
jgi:hypothetical protein